MSIIVCILIVLFIIFVTCYNTLDKWRFRADRQYPYVRETMDEWEAATLELLSLRGVQPPEGHVKGQKHPWDAVAAANRLAAACPGSEGDDDDARAVRARQRELAEKLETYTAVYNGTAKSFNKTASRPFGGTVAKLLHWNLWEDLELNRGGIVGVEEL